MGGITKEEKLRRENLAKQGIKVCSKCKRELSFDNFWPDKNTKDGLRCYCRECCETKKRQYYEINERDNEEYKAHRKAYMAQYYQENKDRLLANSKEYYEVNKDVILEKNKIYRETHKEEMAVRSKEWAVKNRDMIKAKKHEKYLKNKDEILEKNRQYRIAHAEEIKEAAKRYRASEYGKSMMKKRKHEKRARQINAKGSYNKTDVEELLLFFNYKCAYTGENLENGYHLDHVVALKNGGTNYIWNLVPSNAIPNSSKGARDMESWFRQQSYFSEERLNKIYEWMNSKRQTAERNDKDE